MAIGTRNGQSYFWSLVNDLFDQDIPNRENFIKGTIHKLQDSIVAGRDLVFGLAQQLGSTIAGTSAVQRGSVAMGTLAFYDPISNPVGDLDGKTLILETDLAGPVTVTFAQPISPAHAATQINTQAAALGLVASVDTGVDPNTGAVVAANVGKLLLVRPSGASAEVTVKGAGTANALLGLPLIDTTTTGAGTVNDGASRVGLAAITATIPWAGGTLRDFLAAQYALVNASASALATKVAKAGDTMSGNLALSGVAKIVYSAAASRPARGAWTKYSASFLTLTGGALQYSNIGSGSADFEFYPVTGDTITSITISVFVEPGFPHGALPTMPTYQLYKWVPGATTPTAIGANTPDPSADVAAYELPHDITISGLSEVVSSSARYFLRYTTESGANAQPGYTVTNVTLAVTSAGLPPGL